MKTQNKKQLKIKAQLLLPKPGVYRMLDKDGNLLYIGKSKKLNQRVASYFSQGTSERSRKIERMIKQIRDFEVYYTDTELDALLLECHWIQNQKPPYNTVLTKSGKYRYFEIYGHTKYMLKLSAGPKKGACMRIGPFPHKYLAQSAYQFMKTYYPEFFKDYGKDKLFIKAASVMRCYEDPLVSLVEECLKKDGSMSRKLEKLMISYADAWAYEEAAKVLEALKGLKYMQYIYELMEKVNTEEIIGILPIEGTRYWKYYRISQGRIMKRIKGVKSEEEHLIAYLKEIPIQHSKLEDNYILPHEIDPIRIIQSFKQRGMRWLKV